MQRQVSEAIRGLVDADFSAAFPNVPLVYDNAPFDWNSPTSPFAELQVEFYSGAQVNLARDPKTRLRGCVYANVYHRPGQGDLVVLDLLDWFITKLQYQSPGPVRFQAPDPEPSETFKGWHIRGVKVPFYADEV